MKPSMTSPWTDERHLRDQLRQLGLLSPKIEGAIARAGEVHGQQRRDDGTPYVEEHVYSIASAVCDYVAQRGWPNEQAEEAVAIALLHDTLEDSDSLAVEALPEQFGTAVARGVAALTKGKKSDFASPEEREAAYFEGVYAAPPVAKVGKVFDRLNDLSCIHKSTPEKRQRCLEETRRFHVPLASSVDETLEAEMLALIDRLEA